MAGTRSQSCGRSAGTRSWCCAQAFRHFWAWLDAMGYADAAVAKALKLPGKPRSSHRRGYTHAEAAAVQQRCRVGADPMLGQLVVMLAERDLLLTGELILPSFHNTAGTWLNRTYNPAVAKEALGHDRSDRLLHRGADRGAARGAHRLRAVAARPGRTGGLGGVAQAPNGGRSVSLGVGE